MFDFVGIRIVLFADNLGILGTLQERFASRVHLLPISPYNAKCVEIFCAVIFEWTCIVVVATAMAGARSRGMCANYMQTSCEGENECLACARDLRPANRPRPIQQHLTVSAVSSDVAHRYSLLYCYYYYHVRV